MVEQIFEEMDSNESGSIDLIEFTSAAMQFTEKKNKDKIRIAFKMFDLVKDFGINIVVGSKRDDQQRRNRASVRVD